MLTLYDRDAGIVCLETDVFEDAADLPGLLGALLPSPLVWHWSSDRRYPAQPQGTDLNLPGQRDWTRVTAANMNLLAADFVEQDLNDDRRQVLLIGADRDLLATLSDSEATRRLLSDFAAEQPPVRMALVQLGDTGSILIFIPHQPSMPAQHLLTEWGVSIAAARKRLPWRRLHLARFEELFGLREDS